MNIRPSRIGLAALAVGFGSLLVGFAGGSRADGVAADGVATEPTTKASPGVLRIAKLPPPKDPFVTDEQIGAAIEKGQTWLMSQFVNSKILDYGKTVADIHDDTPSYYGTGADALAVYALLQCGLASHKPELDPSNRYMKGLLDTLKSMDITLPPHTATYGRGIRATALALANRKEDFRIIGMDVEGLLDSCREGAFTYSMPPDGEHSFRQRGYLMPFPQNMGWDNSNSQYGLLGVWSAAEVGAEIPAEFWQVVEKHWNDGQLANGQWEYGSSHPGGTITMTLAGLASLFVCHDYIDTAKVGISDVGRDPFTPQLLKGLNWLSEKNNASLDYSNGYGRYGLERVGLASGFKYFGTHDWYREQATRIVKSQEPGGSWKTKEWFANEMIDTCYELIFLSRGRHPILMNKLRFEHYWANRPRDVARLGTYAGHELETVFNWQVVGLDHDWSDWTDAPILYMASHEAPALTDEDYGKIRSFVNAGGLLLTQADGGSPAFNTYIEKVLLPKVFGEYEMEPVPPGHDVYSLLAKLKTKTPLKMVSNGARALWIHSPTDLGQWWQQRASKTHKDAFDLGLNLFIYAAGKTDFSNRLSSSYISAPPAGDAANSIEVARVKYPLRTWDPEPFAWERFARWMGWQTSVGIRRRTVEMEDLGGLKPSEVPLAHLTGTNPYSPTPAQTESIRKYVDNGGVLFLDACGGGGFNETIRKMLASAFPEGKLERLTSSSPLLSAGGEGMNDLSKPMLRSYARSQSFKPDGFLGFKSGKGWVIYSSQDITNGLLGSRTWGINGYESPYCLDFMKNLVLWAARGAN